MGKLEQKSRRRNIKKLILQTVGTAGVVGVAVLSPQVVAAAVQVGFLPNPRDREIIKRATARLERSGLLEKEGGGYVLTKEGEKALREWEFANHKLERPKRWDGKWRIVIFDIPEKLKKSRDNIRYLLSSAGFVRLQDSVWVYPYDCEDVITLLKTDFGVDRHLLYLIVDQLENDTGLRHEFDLPLD